MKNLIIALFLMSPMGSFAASLTCDNNKEYIIDTENKTLTLSWAKEAEILMTESSDNRYIFKGSYLGGFNSTFYIDRTSLSIREVTSSDGMVIEDSKTKCKVVSPKI